MEAYKDDVENYCDEFKSTLGDYGDPGEFGLDNFNEWLESQGEESSDLTEDEFAALVKAVDYDPETNEWVNQSRKQ